jgi:two-component system sensor histidine kinase DesK
MNNSIAHNSTPDSSTPTNGNPTHSASPSVHNAMKLCEAPGFQRHQWVWWIFSLYYFIPAFYLPFGWLSHSLIVLAYAVFLLLCIITAKVNRAKAWQPISALILLAAATSYITPGASSFFSYIGFFIGFCFATRQFVIYLIALILGIIALHFSSQYPIPYFLFPALTGVGTIGMIGIVERMRYQARIKELQSHHEIRQLAMIAERERIARDLHDILGHTLSSVVLKAELADKLLQQNRIDDARQHMEDLHKIARESLSLVRQTVSGYKHRGLSSEVCQLCEKLRTNGFTVDLNGKIPQLIPQAETALILALTELTTNILRHSNGNHCTLTFDDSSDNLLISLKDNGVTDTITPGNGLRGIQERLEALTGNLYTEIKDGCHFVITLPLQELVRS